MNQEREITGFKMSRERLLSRMLSPALIAGLAVLVLVMGASAGQAQTEKMIFKFAFAPGKVAPGYIQVLPTTVYTKELGYGFDLGSKVTAVDRGGDDALHSGFCTSEQPFFFSVAVPEGNYDVTVTLGDPKGESITTVKAESRRLMLERVLTPPGKFETRTFTVNVRNSKVPPPPQNAPGGSEVVLNSREQGVLHWDDKLTLEFNNSRPCVCALEITRADDIPTMFLAGDSTVTDQTREPTTSWGQMLTRFFKSGVAIANHAESGETLKSFISGLRLAKVLSQIKRDDYLFIQFGHNDEKKNWPQTYVDPATTFKAYLKAFIAEARLRGATPVIISPMERMSGANGNTHGDFPEAARQVAKEENVAFIDLHSMSKILYQALGQNIRLAFNDGTHHSKYGAYELARCIVEGIKANKLDLAKYIADDVPAFDPAHPDPIDSLTLVASPGKDRGTVTTVPNMLTSQKNRRGARFGSWGQR